MLPSFDQPGLPDEFGFGPPSGSEPPAVPPANIPPIGEFAPEELDGYLEPINFGRDRVNKRIDSSLRVGLYFFGLLRDK